MPCSSSSIRFACSAFAVLALTVSTGCSSLSQPFSGMKDARSQMTVYRLQNFEPPAQAAQTAAPGGFQLPPQIQQWITAGASLLPPGLLPPGLIPGAAPAPTPTAADAPRFHNFRILDYVQVADDSVKNDVLTTFGTQSNFQSPTQSCMYAELGFAIQQPNNPTPADILVSLSCQQVAAFNFAWPYQQTGLTSDTDKKFSDIVKRVFQGR